MKVLLADATVSPCSSGEADLSQACCLFSTRHTHEKLPACLQASLLTVTGTHTHPSLHQQCHTSFSQGSLRPDPAWAAAMSKEKNMLMDGGACRFVGQPQTGLAAVTQLRWRSDGEGEGRQLASSGEVAQTPP
ncbi:hypothetical protein AOLI_G00138270 [Acnodon oligacanthus]